MAIVRELRIVITVDDFDRAIRFYRDEIGLTLAEEWDTEAGHGVLFEAGKATLEVFDRAQKESIDTMEAGRITAGDVRLAMKVDDVDEAYHELVVQGSPLLSHPFDAPWGDRVARLQTPHGMQLTLFADNA